MLTKMVLVFSCLVMLGAETTTATVNREIRSLDMRRQGHPSTNRAQVWMIPETRKARYKIQLQLPNLKMSPALGDTNSARYRELSRTLTSDIEQLLSKVAGDHRVYNIRFSDYSNGGKRHSSLEKTKLQKETNILRHSDDAKSGHSTPSPLSSSSSKSTTQVYKKKSKINTTRQSELKMAPPSSTKASVLKTSPTPIISSALSFARRTEKAKINATKGSVDVAKLTSSLPATFREVIRATITSPTILSVSSGNSIFNAALVTRLFKQCYRRSTAGEYEVLLKPYVDAYTELLRIFNVLGPIYSFAEQNAMAKLAKLRNLWELDKKSGEDNYSTFQNMFAYEHSPRGEKAKLEGVSINRLLHRSLKFISGFIKVSLNTKDGESLGSQLKDLYSQVLAPYHEWYVQAAVYLALLTFPSKGTLLSRMNVTDTAEVRQEFMDLSSAMDAIYDDVQILYEKYKS